MDGPIHSKSKAFAIRMFQLEHYLQERHEFAVANQIFKSGTSIGANIRESKNAQSKADFINKLSIALKEADETLFWLEILYESQTIDKDMFNSLYADCIEITKLLTSILKTTKQKLNDNKN